MKKKDCGRRHLSPRPLPAESKLESWIGLIDCREFRFHPIYRLLSTWETSISSSDHQTIKIYICICNELVLVPITEAFIRPNILVVLIVIKSEPYTKIVFHVFPPGLTVRMSGWV